MDNGTATKYTADNAKDLPGVTIVKSRPIPKLKVVKGRDGTLEVKEQKKLHTLSQKLL